MQVQQKRWTLGIKSLLLAVGIVLPAAERLGMAADGRTLYQKKATWAETLLKARETWGSAGLPAVERTTNLFLLGEAIKADFPLPWDWALQDSDGRFSDWFDTGPGSEWERRLISRALDGLPQRGGLLRGDYDALCRTQPPPAGARWWDLYL